VSRTRGTEPGRGRAGLPESAAGPRAGPAAGPPADSAPGPATGVPAGPRADPGADPRAVEWTGDGVRLLDQTALPARESWLDITDIDGLVDAVRRLAVRGAPALGAVGGMGVALAMIQGRAEGWDPERLGYEIDRVRTARPTAVNLAWGVDRVCRLVPRGLEAVVAEAQAIVAEDGAANRAIGRFGAEWIQARVAGARAAASTASAGPAPIRVLTHCNAGLLATAEWGTALGVIRELHGRGALGLVYADETRPLLQGARLTAWELDRLDIPHVVQADGAAASTIMRGLVDVAVIGADRVMPTGDVVNKIGSLGVALACAEAGVPFVVAAPESTIDRAAGPEAEIPIELRDEDEVLSYQGVRVAPERSRGFNPAFDVTPARLVTALVTERGVFEVSAGHLPSISPEASG
jgi:methylthioribose-1-phosphate isomerase